MMEDYQKQVAEARKEADKIIEEARGLGEPVRKEVVEKANTEASAVVQRAQERDSPGEGERHPGDEGHGGQPLRGDRVEGHREESQRGDASATHRQPHQEPRQIEKA